MISVSVFNLLIALAAVFGLYSWIDINHKLYGNIASGFISALLFGYTAVIANTGIVDAAGDVMQDLSLQIFLLIPAASMMIYSAYMLWDAWDEYQHQGDVLP